MSNTQVENALKKLNCNHSTRNHTVSKLHIYQMTGEQKWRFILAIY